MTVFVSSRRFEDTHGYKPRGRAIWHFEVDFAYFSDGPPSEDERILIMPPHGTFTEARTFAIDRARRLAEERGFTGSVVVSVLP